MTPEQIEKLKARAAELATVAGEQSRAHDVEGAAEVELLDSIVETVRPALKALASRIQVSHLSQWVSSSDTDETDLFMNGVKGLRVIGDGAFQAHPSANRGHYAGNDLYLTTAGTWLELRYDGSWSRWQGEGDDWTAEQERLNTSEVVERYSVADIIEAISSAVEAQLEGNRTKATKAALRRAETTNALVTLLRQGGRR
jgi:hypothetical protein